MLASFPASILNHIRFRTGIPSDSVIIGNALVARYHDGATGFSELIAAFFIVLSVGILLAHALDAFRR